MTEALTKTAAAAIVGGLSSPGKMPEPGYGLSAFDCQTGARLRLVPGSTCADCYACKDKYVWPGAKAAHARRLATVAAALADDRARKLWVRAMATLLRDVPHFRWHDSGDLQSTEHFELIVDVCRATPGTQHWLPTREPRYVKRSRRRVPRNLTVRVSAPMVDGPAPGGFPCTSTVHARLEPAPGSHVCPAPQQGGKCADCRACWDRRVRNVSYLAH